MVKDVAKRLGCTPRSVWNYVHAGLLKTKKEDGRTIFNPAEVDELAIELGANFPRLSRQAFYRLYAEVQQLKNDMSTVRRIIGYPDYLRPTPEEAAGFYAAARSAMERGSWALAELKMWADLFDRMDELCLNTVIEVSGDPTAWKLFYMLCLSMLASLAADPSLKTDLQLQHLQQRLHGGRKCLRGTIILWAEIGKLGPGSEKLAHALDDGEEALVRRLGKTS